MATKDTNPKDALGVRKVGLSHVPMGPLLELGNAMLEGGCKYGTHNYRAAGVRYKIYFDSTVRHMIDWWEGEDIDPDSGVHHVTKAIAGLMVLRDSMLCGNDVDDRPLRYLSGLGMNKYNEQAGAILDKYPDRVEPFTQKRKELMDAVDLSGMPESPVGKVLIANAPIEAGQPVQYVEPISLKEMPKLEPPVVTLTDKEGVTEKLEEVNGSLELPDDNHVPENDPGKHLDTDDPKKTWFCDHTACFNRGRANAGKYTYLCPEHQPDLEIGDDNV